MCPIVNEVIFFSIWLPFSPDTTPLVQSKVGDKSEEEDSGTRTLPETCNNVQQNISEGHAAGSCHIFTHFPCHFMTIAL